MLVTSAPPPISLDETYEEAIIKQLITLSCENWVFLSVQIMKRKMKKNEPNNSEIYAAKSLVANVPTTGTGVSILYFEMGVKRKLQTNAEMIPPMN
jgi:hypothetical protein